MTNLTKWFQLIEQTPWEVGVYEVQVSHLKKADGMLSFFDGSIFRYIENDVDSAFNARERYTNAKVTHWRGLSTNHEVKKKTSGNRKVTMYVVMSHYHQDTHSQAIAVFSSLKSAQSRAEEVKKTVGSEYEVWVSLTRFRTPE